LTAEHVRSIAIAGGGPEAWLAAAALARLLKSSFCDVCVIDPPTPTAETFSKTALPSFHRLNGLLGIDECDLIKKTRGTFRLGAQFADWGRMGDRYFHTFGPLGAKLDAVPFQHYWFKLRQAGDETSIEHYSTATMAATMHRFAHPTSDRQSVLSFYSHGYHFHARQLAAHLREYAEARGVRRIDRNVVEVSLRSADGFVDGLGLDDGSLLRADLYIDCTGIESTLARHVLKDGYRDTRRWLPCDRAVTLLCKDTTEPAPCAESTALRCGWRWRTPLQGCMDVGYAYSSAHIGDDQAAAALLADFPGAALSEPRFLRFLPGPPAKFWDKNCLVLPGAALEPLESTGLHLAQTGIARLLTLFPISRYSPNDIDEYNRLTTIEYERIRDFQILHFKASQRSDSPFWEQCRNMAIPDTLRAKIELYSQCGRIAMFDEEHFLEDSWLALFIGQNCLPLDYDPLADVLGTDAVKEALLRMRSMIRDGVETLPTHAQFIATHCSATPSQVYA
jgi:tryptophan halogenase